MLISNAHCRLSSTTVHLPCIRLTRQVKIRRFLLYIEWISPNLVTLELITEHAEINSYIATIVLYTL